MKAGSERYEKCIADTSTAVDRMRRAFGAAATPFAYIQQLRGDLHNSAAFQQVYVELSDRKHIFQLTQGRYGEAFPSNLPLLYEHAATLDGAALGLTACRETLGRSFDRTMFTWIDKTLTSDEQHPMRYANNIIARSINTYNYALDAPMISQGPIGQSDELPPSSLRDFAEKVRSDLSHDALYSKYFKVGVGIARTAYNSYVLDESKQFDRLLKDNGFADNFAQ